MNKKTNKNKFDNSLASSTIKDYSDVFDYDLDHGIVSIDFRFDSVDDFIDKSLSNEKHYMFKEDDISDLLSMIATIPKNIKVNINYCFSKLGKYNPNTLLDSLKKAIKSRFYTVDEAHRRKIAFSFLFMVVGIIIIVLSYNKMHFGLFESNDDVISNIVKDIFGELSSMLIWEAGCIFFLTYDDEVINKVDVYRRFNSFTIKNKNNKKLASIERKDIYNDWPIVDRKVRIADYTVLFIVLYVAISNTIEIVGLLTGIYQVEQKYFIGFVAGNLVTVINLVLVILYYLDYEIGRKYALPVTIFCFIVYFIYVILSCPLLGTRELASNILDLILSFVACVALAYSVKRKYKNEK